MKQEIRPHFHEKEENGNIFYHGTTALGEFNSFDRDLIYLSPDKPNAAMFAENPILNRGKKGRQRVLKIIAKDGKSKDITAEVLTALNNDKDIDAAIREEAKKARQQGFRYITFDHPGATDADFTATISLYPKEDLNILQSCSMKQKGKISL